MKVDSYYVNGNIYTYSDQSWIYVMQLKTK